MSETANQPGQDSSVSWTAPEFIAHHKSAGWYFNLTALAILLAAVLLLITRDWVSAAVVIACAGFLAIYAGRQPRRLEYQVDQSGIKIAGKRYGYNEFKAFYIVNEGQLTSINLLPLKRFSLLLTIYYEPADEPKITNILADKLPMEETRRDVVEGLMRRIRF
jgi:hypothetical protein